LAVNDWTVNGWTGEMIEREMIGGEWLDGEMIEREMIGGE